MSITAEQFQVAHDLFRIGSTEDGITLLRDEIVDHSRWAVLHERVFSFGGKFYAYFYRAPATENQYEEDPTVDDVYEVEPREKTVTYYQRIGA